MNAQRKSRQRKAVPVRAGRPWGVIALFGAVGVLAVAIIGYAGFAAWQGSRPWDDQLTGLDEVVDYRSQNPAWLTANHKSGSLTYQVTPPVGGDHSSAWQNCTGDVYDAPIANENAAHSLEHGAVWVTYRTGLPADQVEQLAGKVRGTEYLMMSPVDGLATPITVQGWGYRLGVQSADDSRIDGFIEAARVNAGLEQGAPGR